MQLRETRQIEVTTVGSGVMAEEEPALVPEVSHEIKGRGVGSRSSLEEFDGK